jgi:hypothetical protein
LLAPRASQRAPSSESLSTPAWASSARGNEVFLTMSGDIAGVAVWDDSRGWGTYAEIAVARGTLAEIVAVVGAMQPVPRSPGDLRSGDKVVAYVQRGDRTLRVFVELSRADPSAAQRVTVHFQR